MPEGRKEKHEDIITMGMIIVIILLMFFIHIKKYSMFFILPYFL